jgi:hypothetical protein
MTHRARILADRLIAAPVAFLFNGLARVLGAVLQRDHSMTSANINRVVVAKLIGMGSVLQATPLLKALKQRYPHCTLTFVTMRSNQGLIRRPSCVDEVLGAGRSKHLHYADYHTQYRCGVDSAPSRLVFRFGIVFGLRFPAGAMRGDGGTGWAFIGTALPSKTGFTHT